MRGVQADLSPGQSGTLAQIVCDNNQIYRGFTAPAAFITMAETSGEPRVRARK
jgi:hypothetical protein